MLDNFLTDEEKDWDNRDEMLQKDVENIIERKCVQRRIFEKNVNKKELL